MNPKKKQQIQFDGCSNIIKSQLIVSKALTQQRCKQQLAFSAVLLTYLLTYLIGHNNSINGFRPAAIHPSRRFCFLPIHYVLDYGFTNIVIYSVNCLWLVGVLHLSLTGHSTKNSPTVSNRSSKVAKRHKLCG